MESQEYDINWDVELPELSVTEYSNYYDFDGIFSFNGTQTDVYTGVKLYPDMESAVKHVDGTDKGRVWLKNLRYTDCAAFCTAESIPELNIASGDCVVVTFDLVKRKNLGICVVKGKAGFELKLCTRSFDARYGFVVEICKNKVE